MTNQGEQRDFTMEDMEVDFLFGDDPISNFLLRKLEEVKCTNENLEREIETRRDLLKRCEEKVNKPCGGLSIVETWKRILNSKCIFGIVVNNTTPSIHLKVTDVILNWNSSSPITYSIKTYSKHNGVDDHEWLDTDKFLSSATILLVVMKPSFLKQQSYNLEGIIKHKQMSDEYQKSLPKLTVSSSDFVDGVLEVQRVKLIQGSEQEFLSHLGASEAVDLIGRLPNEMDRKTESVLGIDCMFREVNITSKNKYFVVDGIAASIDGCLIELKLSGDREKFAFKILSSNQEQMKQLLHYLYETIDGISILPQSHDVYSAKPCLSTLQSSINVENTDDLRQALLHEITCIEDFYANKVKDDKCNRSNFIKFRNDLNKLEFKTDTICTKSNVLL